MRIDVQSLTVVELEAEIRAYEVRYGLPSSRACETFDQGEPTEDQFRWLMLYAAWRAAGLPLQAQQ